MAHQCKDQITQEYRPERFWFESDEEHHLTAEMYGGFVTFLSSKKLSVGAVEVTADVEEVRNFAKWILKRTKSTQAPSISSD